MSLGSPAEIAKYFTSCATSVPFKHRKRPWSGEPHHERESYLRRPLDTVSFYRGSSYPAAGASGPFKPSATRESAAKRITSKHDKVAANQPCFSLLDKSVKLAFEFVAACLVCWTSTWAATALNIDLPSTDVSKEQYERAIKSHSPRSNLPSKGEAEMLLQLDKDLFTDDAWEGMKT